MDSNVIADIMFGYGIEQFVIGAIVSLAVMPIKRKFKLDLRRELIVRIIISLAFSSLLAGILSKEYAWAAATVSGSLGLSYIISNLAGKKKSPTAEQLIKSIAPDLTTEQIKAALKNKFTQEEIRGALTELLGGRAPESEIEFLAGIITALKTFGY